MLFTSVHIWRHYKTHPCCHKSISVFRNSDPGSELLPNFGQVSTGNKNFIDLSFSEENMPNSP